MQEVLCASLLAELTNLSNRLEPTNVPVYSYKKIIWLTVKAIIPELLERMTKRFYYATGRILVANLA
jgi:hypothetical protein